MAAETESPAKVMPAYQVVCRPLVTEKNVRASNEQNQYAFEIHPSASKSDVKRAIEELFDVKVVKVRTQCRVGKPRRHRNRMTLTPAWKKAIVTLHADNRIDFF